MLIRGLPVNSATRTAMNGGRPLFEPFQYQLADMHDVLAQANWQRANEGVPKNKLSRMPDKYPRPEQIREADERAAARKLKLADARRRAAERRELIASGAIP